MSILDTITPAGPWTFDQAVTDAFDDMLSRSIPAHDTMRDLTTALAVRYARAQPAGRVVDLGCSRGRALAPIAQALGHQRSYVAVDTSAPMRAAAAETLAEYVDAGACEVRATDLRHDFPDDAPAAVILSVLTLQFTPIEYRHAILTRAHDALMPGGALLLVEKVLGDDHHLDQALTETYHAMKGAHGYSADAIARKAASLEGVLVPVTDAWNRELLRAAGFTHVDTYWRALNFAGYLAVR
ncbi:methyltransferase domain-containing protein [Georgenia sp. M64]|uniref:methyltransferase domain-containing protein n=1 Tax=Georgenia sp. M64 TaxID=3120520 RepID=UPI0030E351F0